MSDPYRGTTLVPCARCREGLERGSCPRGHGYWDASALPIHDTALGELGTLVPHQLHVGRCPSCRTPMQLRRWQGVTIEVCARHGTWVAEEDADYFLGHGGRSR